MDSFILSMAAGRWRFASVLTHKPRKTEGNTSATVSSAANSTRRGDLEVVSPSPVLKVPFSSVGVAFSFVSVGSTFRILSVDTTPEDNHVR